MSKLIRFGGGASAGGLTLEEIWLMTAIISKDPMIFVINNQQPPQPISGVGRKTLISPDKIIYALKNSLPILTKSPSEMHLDERKIYGTPYSTCVYDGAEVAHTISLDGIDKKSGFFIYHDSWGGRSLLCKENNSANVAAVPHPKIDNLWLVNSNELRSVIYAVIMPYKNWKNISI